MLERRKAEKIVDGLNRGDARPPTMLEHRHPFDEVRAPYDKDLVDPRSKLHALTILLRNKQVMLYYMNVGPQYMEPIARQLYQEISLIEQEHSRTTSRWSTRGKTGGAAGHPRVQRMLAVLLVHGAGERPEIRRSGSSTCKWNSRICGRRRTCSAATTVASRSRSSAMPGFPEPLLFEPNKEFLRHLLATQMDLTKLGEGYVREAHERFEWMQQQLHAGQRPPSEEVIELHRAKFGDSTGSRPKARTRWSRCAPPKEPAVPDPRSDTASRASPPRPDRPRRGRRTAHPAHARIEELFLLVTGSTGTTRRDAFDDLVLSWPCTRRRRRNSSILSSVPMPGAGGDALVDDRLEEERLAKETLTALGESGVERRRLRRRRSAAARGGTGARPA
jgi:hypothetical protein